MINNAGVSCVESCKDLSMNQLNTLVNVNAISPILLSRYLLAHQFTDQTQQYAILNIATLTSLYPIGYLSLYSATKAFFHTYSLALH